MTFYLTYVKPAYTSTHTNKSFKPGIDKVVWVISAVSKFCSKFWKDYYDSKTDATWRFTQRSIYFKNLENCLFPKLGVIQKICWSRMTFFWTPLPPISHFGIFFHKTPPPFSFTKTQWQILAWIRNQKKILKNHSAHTTTWLPVRDFA